jgi:hypothetical protein
LDHKLRKTKQIKYDEQGFVFLYEVKVSNMSSERN